MLDPLAAKIPAGRMFVEIVGIMEKNIAERKKDAANCEAFKPLFKCFDEVLVSLLLCINYFCLLFLLIWVPMGARIDWFRNAKRNDDKVS